MILKRFLGLIYYIFHRVFTRDECKVNLGRWFWHDGDNTHLITYSLDNNSLVFDVGGYIGKFSDKIISKYNPNIYIFEPVSSYYQILKTKYRDLEKVRVFNFGLLDRTEKRMISVNGDKSSLFLESGNNEEVQLVDIVEFMETHCPNEEIDLMAVNIEGGEYPLLRKMIESGLINRIDNLLVEFHCLVPRATEMRRELLEGISRTHETIFSYPFMWEGFRKK